MNAARPPITSAIVLSAGLGQRMRPITDTLPKPLVSIGGRAMIDYCLDRLADAGVERAVVNVHHLAEKIEDHVAGRTRPQVTISDERDRLLETGGGIKRALPLLGPVPFLALNSDSLWIEGPQPNLRRFMDAWDPGRMDVLLLLASTATSLGYDGRGDFRMDPAGRLTRRPEREVAPFVYAGVAVYKPEMFEDTPEGSFSANLIFDRAIERERLFGLRLDGQWLHVGTPEAIPEAEARLAASVL